MTYKTELHAHTFPVSRCGKRSPEEVVEHYIENGYTTLVITNHMSPTFFSSVVPEGMTDWKSMADLFLSDYRRAKAYGGDKINIILGMEIRVKKNMNDYLVYGIDEQFVYEMGDVMDMDIKEVAELVHKNDGLIFQAHPFRNGMTVTNPDIIDGVEAANFGAPHDSRNDIAMVWSEKFGMLRVYGTDYHRDIHMIGAGILTDAPIKDSKTLKNVIKTRNFMFTDGKEIYKP